VNASAEYLRGEPHKHAVLVLHGFMTTRNFNTVQSLVNELSDSGYTVLAPTLSLGIDNRNASIPCDAIHTHTWDDDLAEIAFWVNWLVKEGFDSIILVGHSTGSLQLVSYVAGKPASQVKEVVATSLVNIRRYTDPDTASREIADATRLAAMPTPPLSSYHLVFCDNFTATPASYLSYINWTHQRVLDTLRKVKVPVEIIMGGDDRRFSGDWITALQQTGTRVRVIKGASHFFDATHEFDLLDQVQRAIDDAS
jgi:esterase/lipase